MAIPTVNFMSYNSTGISVAKSKFLQDICEQFSVTYASIQEHFKWSKQTNKFFNDKFDKFNCYVIPAYRPKCQESGRAKGGLAQLSLKDKIVKKNRVVTKSWRIQAQILNLPTTRLLWINAYFPTDPQTVDFDDTEVLEVLTEIEMIMDKTDFDDVILNGDLNWDIDRKTTFCNILSSFFEKIGLVSLWRHHHVDHTHVHTDNVSTATLDHFLVNERLLPLVEQCLVLHRGDNMSRHSPILLKLQAGKIPAKQKESSWLPRKPAWYKASLVDIDNYKMDMQARLQSVRAPISLQCSDPHCSDPAHSKERDDHVLDLLCHVVESSHTMLPLAGGRRAVPRSTTSKSSGGNIPGWTENVEPYRQEALFWHSVWISARRPGPAEGDLHTMMSRSRNQYHYAVRRLKLDSRLIRAKKLLEASVNGDTELLKEMKAISRGRGFHDDLPEHVAGADGQVEIVEKFREVYQTLYNSSGSVTEVVDIKAKLAQLVTVESVVEVKKITGETVRKAASLMKSGKSDVSSGFTSDAIINAPDLFFQHLASVYRSWLIHASVTPVLLACAFMPLLKNALKDPGDTGSYRAIAGSSILLKLFDKVVLLLWGHLLASDSLQFGYKVGTSTTQCSWLVSEVVTYFLQRGSNPIVTLLDCSKAFDTCKFSILFNKLLKKNVPPIVVRALVAVYVNQYAWVKWGGARSSLFGISNGTRQGSILSPALFAVYVDDLLQELRSLGVGCYVANLFCGAVGFCDDILLMAPTRDGMQLMLNLCEDFATRNNLQFSTDPNPTKSKTKCIFMVGKRKNLSKPVPLVLSGKELPWVASATHLGHELHESGTMDYDATVKRAEFISKSTEIRETFFFAHPVEVLKAVKMFAGDLYGGNLWQLRGDKAQQVFNAWNTCIKLAWQVPRGTHTYMVDMLLSCGISHVRNDILARYVSFLKSLRESPSQEVSVLVHLVGRDIRTTTGSNLHFIKDLSGLDPWSSSSKGVKAIMAERVKQVPEQDVWRIPYLGRLLEQRGELYYQMLDTTEVTELIESLCIN